ncbi:30S ribosomal protein S6e [Candidatus Woesearchaeota archaeon]|nr:MAG: 30S ribosomal protein S6e [Candidatus Woesearchaeota archaeon]
MVQYKVCVGDPASKKTLKVELSEEQSAALRGKKIGDVVKGDVLGLEGYELEITGGSDNCGFPMRKDVEGTGRKRILAVKGIGLKKNPVKGRRIRKTVAGNTISLRTVQVNMKVKKPGKKPLFEEDKGKEAENAKPEGEGAASQEKQ